MTTPQFRTPWPFDMDQFDLQLARVRMYLAYVEWMRANQTDAWLVLP